MATKRQRGNSWEYIIKRKKLREKPWTFTFQDEEEGDRYVAKLEALLDRGIIPKELQDDKSKYVVIGELIRDYLSQNVVAESDKKLLNVIYGRIGTARITAINYAWIEAWIFGMKTELNLKPTTIRHHVGALARCLDWSIRRELTTLVNNPIRMLPKNYAQYNENDALHAKVINDKHESQEDDSRDRRLGPGEEERILAVMERIKLDDSKERPLEMRWQAALQLLFSLALETCMRMRELTSLNISQIDIENRTISIYKSKTDYETKVAKLKRQIPMTSVAIKDIEDYVAFVKAGERGMAGFNFESGRLFPWIDEEKKWAKERGVLCNDSQAMVKVTARLSAQFGRIFDAAGCKDLRFHDLRHEAISRYFEKAREDLKESEIMQVTGHSSPRMLRRYTHLRPSNIAKKLW